MSCMTLFTLEAAMATMELKCAASHGICIPWPGEEKPKHKALRMSWIVVTDELGKRSLRARWNMADETSQTNTNGGKNE